MRVLVTGGAGFIGANLCRRLVATPEILDVRVIDDLSTGTRDNLAGLDVDLIEGSILEQALLDRAVSRCDAVVHLAAVPSVPRSIKNPMRSHSVNSTGTLLVLEAARRDSGFHVVLASSSSVYGANPFLPKHEALACMPMSPYAASKLAAESYATAYAACFGVPILPFRFFNVFGPLQPAGHSYAAVVPAFVSAAMSGSPLRVDGDGLQSRDFTFVDTVTSVLADAVLRKVTSGPVNLAFGTRTTLLELIKVVEDAVGHALQRLHVPPRLGDVAHSQADSSRLRTLFPDLVPIDLRTGIEKTVEWFRSQPL